MDHSLTSAFGFDLPPAGPASSSAPVTSTDFFGVCSDALFPMSPSGRRNSSDGLLTMAAAAATAPMALTHQPSQQSTAAAAAPNYGFNFELQQYNLPQPMATVATASAAPATAQPQHVAALLAHARSPLPPVPSHPPKGAGTPNPYAAAQPQYQHHMTAAEAQFASIKSPVAAYRSVPTPSSAQQQQQLPPLPPLPPLPAQLTSPRHPPSSASGSALPFGAPLPPNVEPDAFMKALAFTYQLFQSAGKGNGTGPAAATTPGVQSPIATPRPATQPMALVPPQQQQPSQQPLLAMPTFDDRAILRDEFTLAPPLPMELPVSPSGLPFNSLSVAPLTAAGASKPARRPPRQTGAVVSTNVLAESDDDGEDELSDHDDDDDLASTHTALHSSGGTPDTDASDPAFGLLPMPTNPFAPAAAAADDDHMAGRPHPLAVGRPHFGDKRPAPTSSSSPSSSSSPPQSPFLASSSVEAKATQPFAPLQLQSSHVATALTVAAALKAVATKPPTAPEKLVFKPSTRETCPLKAAAAAAAAATVQAPAPASAPVPTTAATNKPCPVKKPPVAPAAASVSVKVERKASAAEKAAAAAASGKDDDDDDGVVATGSTRGHHHLCDYGGCGLSFKTRFSLKRHKKRHTGEKPFACHHPGCHKTFAEKSTLSRHQRIHSGEKPFGCRFPGCGKRFADRTNVKRHEQTHVAAATAATAATTTTAGAPGVPAPTPMSRTTMMALVGSGSGGGGGGGGLPSPTATGSPSSTNSQPPPPPAPSAITPRSLARTTAAAMAASMVRPATAMEL